MHEMVWTVRERWQIKGNIWRHTDCRMFPYYRAWEVTVWLEWKWCEAPNGGISSVEFQRLVESVSRITNCSSSRWTSTLLTTNTNTKYWFSFYLSHVIRWHTDLNPASVVQMSAVLWEPCKSQTTFYDLRKGQIKSDLEICGFYWTAIFPVFLELGYFLFK